MMYVFAKAKKHAVVAILIAFGLNASGCPEVPVSPPPGANDVRLTSLTVSPGDELIPKFSSNATTYTTTVPAEVISVVVTATPQDNAATVAINGMITPGGAKQSVTLRPANMPTPIEIVTSVPAGETKTYTVMVTRLGSSDASLASLSVSKGTLEPGFSPNEKMYSVTVEYPVDSVVVTATKADRTAAMSGSVSADPGVETAEATILLGPQGSTTPASIAVTAQNGELRNYALTIHRLVKPLSDDSSLSALTIAPGSLVPAFAPATTMYSGKINILTNDTTLVFTKSDPNSSMSYGNQVIAPAGVLSASVAVKAVGLGASPKIAVTVISESGTSQTTYTVDVVKTFQLDNP